MAHLRVCRRCRSLLVGFERTAGVLGGAWADRALNRGLEIPEGTARVRLSRPDGFGRSAGRGMRQRAAVPAAMVAILVAVVATAGLLTLRSAGTGPASSGPAVSMAGATPYGTLRTTGLVARLPLGQYASFEWSPDGQHLLVSDESGSIVYDRSGKQVSAYGQFEGWLDATHLISGNGHVASIDEPYTGGPTSNSWVVGNGYGSAAIIVAVPGCTCDPLVDWYENGQYVKVGEKATPYGWSPDGKLVLLGHLEGGSQDVELHGWKGSVDVVDFASGRVLATAPNVRGEMAFNPSATRLAAQSDADLEIVTIAGGSVQTIAGARFLGWFDDDHLYYQAGATLEMLNLRSGASASAVVGSGEWQVPAPAGSWLVVDSTGAVRRIVAADWTTTLLDLSSTSLLVDANQASDQAVSALQQRWWSPDGRMLAVPSSDGTSLALLAVTDLPGSIAGALPTPIASPQAIAELDRTALPGPVGALVSDPARDAFWFLGGESGGPIDLYRYNVATAKLSSSPIAGTTYDETRDRLAIAPDGRLWIGAGYDLIVYDPATAGQTSLTLPASGPDVQADPKLGKADPWIAGIAFDASGNALIARNWVRSLARVDGSPKVTGSIDVSDGFPMTGGVVVAGGRVFVLVDPASGLCLGVDATGSQTLSNLKFQAPALAAVGDLVLLAGTPPGWIDANGGAAMIEPVMASADLVAAGPDGTAVLYSSAAGVIQWRDAEGKVSAQGIFEAGSAPQIVMLAFDGQGRLWAVETAGGTSSLVRLSLGA
jgi:WD40 repeat protein